MRLKGIFCSAVLLVLSQSTLAATPWYISANAGIFQGMYDAQYDDITDVIAQNIRQPLHQRGYTIGAALGYSKIVSKKYLMGVELSGNYAGDNANFASGASSTAFTDLLTTSGNIDLVFVPGVFLTNSIATYLKLGLSYTTVSAKLRSPTSTTPTYVINNSSTNLLGVALGIGVKKHISKNTAVFTEYNFHDYGTANFPNFLNFTATYTHAVHVYSQSAVVGITYFL